MYEHVLASDAYRNLDTYCRALLIEFMRRYNGSNNGKIHMSVREAAAACNCSQKPMRRSLDTLQELGFIKLKKQGGFNVKVRHASEWELTEYPVANELATKEFMRWKDPKTSIKNNKTDQVEKKSRCTESSGTVYPEQHCKL